MIRDKNTLALEIEPRDLKAIYALASKLKLPAEFDTATYEVTQTARYLEAFRRLLQEQQVELGFTVKGVDKAPLQK